LNRTRNLEPGTDLTKSFQKTSRLACSHPNGTVPQANGFDRQRSR
jgi:hypothetical protein